MATRRSMSKSRSARPSRGMKMAHAFSPEMKDANLDWDSITAMIQDGEQGKIVEVEDEVDQRPLRSGWNDRHSQPLI